MSVDLPIRMFHFQTDIPQHPTMAATQEMTTNQNWKLHRKEPDSSPHPAPYTAYPNSCKLSPWQPQPWPLVPGRWPRARISPYAGRGTRDARHYHLIRDNIYKYSPIIRFKSKGNSKRTLVLFKRFCMAIVEAHIVKPSRVKKWGPQHGPASMLAIDKKFVSMAPGQRVSKYGHTYYEYRPNRTDLSKKKRL